MYNILEFSSVQPVTLDVWLRDQIFKDDRWSFLISKIVILDRHIEILCENYRFVCEIFKTIIHLKFGYILFGFLRIL